jgi:hypothetical protein
MRLPRLPGIESGAAHREVQAAGAPIGLIEIEEDQLGKSASLR